MIERVAMALSIEDNGQSFAAERSHNYLPMARAAIEAMREPTDAMIAEGNAYDECAPYDIYESMIDAALGE